MYTTVKMPPNVGMEHETIIDVNHQQHVLTLRQPEIVFL
jgi:hypothetical protein